MNKVKAIILGYGSRGNSYAQYAIDHPEELEIVAVADPVVAKRETAQKQHNLSKDQVYADWREIAQKPKMADFAIISMQDKMHYEPALAMIDKGYHLLLEKPMAPTALECKHITEAAERKGVKVVVCHVLRFTKFWYKLKDMIDDGAVGEIMSIIHMERVGNVHQSHSYVRGNWRREDKSSPMIMAKSCHDSDILQWLIGKRCKKVQSFGSLVHFTKENRPEGAPDYCVKGCPAEKTCLYSAIKLYYDDKENIWFRGVATNKVEMPTDEEVWEAISHGPYGRCVYACDNDVVDHQVVNMEFEGGCTVSFTMNAFNEGGRSIRIFGTKGEITADMEAGTIALYSFETKEWTHHNLGAINGELTGGHGGGDTGIMIDMLKYMRGEETSKSICSLRDSYISHLICFAAEESRAKDIVVDLDAFSKDLI